MDTGLTDRVVLVTGASGGLEMRSRAIVAMWVLLCISVSVRAEAPSWYRREDTWLDTLLASRQALLDHEARRAVAAGAGVAPLLGPWLVLGPLAPHDDESWQPSAPGPSFAAGYSGAAGGKARWNLRLDLVDGLVHELFSGRHDLFLYRTITTRTAADSATRSPTTLPVHLDATGRVTVWLNGKQVTTSQRRIRHDLWGGDVQVTPVAIPLRLEAGRNDLLVRIAVRPGPRPDDRVDPWRRLTAEARRPWGTVFTGYSVRTGPAEAYERLVHGEVSQLYFSTRSSLGPDSGPRTLARERLWHLLRRDFPQSRRRMDRERKDGIWLLDWAPGDFRELGRRYAGAIRHRARRSEAEKLGASIEGRADLERVRELYDRHGAAHRGADCLNDETHRRTLLHELRSLRLAITDLSATYGRRYPGGAEFLSRLDAIDELVEEAAARKQESLFAAACARLEKLRYEALLANPLIGFERLLLIKRRANPFLPSLPMNWASNSSLSKTGHDNEIAVLTTVGREGEISAIYKPEGRRFVGDTDLHFDGDRLLFSMPGRTGGWHVYEIGTDGSGLRQVTVEDKCDVDNYDACYLPDGRIVFCSTACFAGVPCVRGRDHVAVLYLMQSDGSNVRQLCFEQDHDWCPTVLNDGRVLYTRWEYTDTPHFFSRLLFQMNPDGTEQREYYGGNSYWPNAVFYARPIPGHPSKVVGVVSGHHVARRSGELVIFDAGRGRHETDGVVQRIPGRGSRVEPVINDRLVVGSWPKFLHPYPLSEKYFLVSCRMDRASRWSIYLVDVFDNLLLLREENGHDLLEPIPLRPVPRPPVIPDRVDPQRSDATVAITDIYTGAGLEGVPRGTVKKLRLIAYHYAYRDMAEDSQAIGVDASWDTVKLVLGTVPVHDDGSAHFRVPANTPISIQPLDDRGKALQLMRSWMAAMPGEALSCVGCHTSQTSVPATGSAVRTAQKPDEIAPWYGPARGFSFGREVQPVLDKYCASCHDGSPREDGKTIPDLSATKGKGPRGFSPAYLELHRFVRRPGAESDYHVLRACEYHADTSELVQLLEKGHYGVELDGEAWDRLITWIDLNVPFHGTWGEAQGAQRVGEQRELRRRLRRRYTGLNEDPEAVFPVRIEPVEPTVPKPPPDVEPSNVSCSAWPFAAEEAERRQRAAGPTTVRTIELGQGVRMELVLVPAGEFVMGDGAGYADERPRAVVRIPAPFWMGKFEVTNEQYGRFDSSHDSRYVRTHGITSTRGYPLNQPRQPVVRVSWQEAMEFCRWLSRETGEDFTLPTEAEWEYACRAGTATPLFYGSEDADFSGVANLADKNVAHLRDYSHSSKLAWMPRDDRFDDGHMVTAPVGTYEPNPWGLCDMHGNACEWTRSAYGPHRETDIRSDAAATGRRVVRGGSWRDRPRRARSAFGLSYRPWQGVFNVGFRVVSGRPSGRDRE